MKSFFSWLGPVVFGVLAINLLSQYESHWKFGRLWMPSTLLDAAGEAYRDGKAVDAITLAIAKSGYEQEAWLAAAGVMLALLIWAVLVIRRVRRDAKTMEATNREIRRLYGLPCNNEVDGGMFRSGE